MKSILLLLALLAQKTVPVREFPADIDAAKEAKLSEKQIFANSISRVFHVVIPSGVKELHFAPDKTGFFVAGAKQVIWHDRPVIIRGEAVHVEFVKHYCSRALRGWEPVVTSRNGAPDPSGGGLLR